MSIKTSNVKFDKILNMYKIDIGFYSRYFEYILYNNKGVQQSFGQQPKEILIDKNFNMNDKLIGFTSFIDYQIVGIIDLNNLKSKYYLVKSAELFEFNIKNNEYYTFVYIDSNNKIGHITNFDDKDFKLKISKNKVTINNKVFGTQVFEKKLNLKLTKQDLFKKSKHRFVDIADFLYFDDFFDPEDNYEGFFHQLKTIHLQDIDIGNKQKMRFFLKKYNYKDLAKIKINISIHGNVENNFECKELKKLLLCYKPNQFLSYTINKEPYQSYFSFIESINNFELKELNLDFSLPKTILNYDPSFEEFQKKFLRLRYGLFNLIDHLDMLDGIQNLEELSYGIVQSKTRALIHTKNLKKTIQAYETRYKEIKKLITKYIIKQKIT